MEKARESGRRENVHVRERERDIERRRKRGSRGFECLTAVHVSMALPCQACLDLPRIPLVPGGPITPHARTQPELDLAVHADSPLSDAVESYRRRIILQSCYLTVSDD
ncbi:hypothetical protein MHYP_G00051160 [Metynnis hypsauchen]